jgi:hypothetical protein
MVQSKNLRVVVETTTSETIRYWRKERTSEMQPFVIGRTYVDARSGHEFTVIADDRFGGGRALQLTGVQGKRGGVLRKGDVICSYSRELRLVPRLQYVDDSKEFDCSYAVYWTDALVALPNTLLADTCEKRTWNLGVLANTASKGQVNNAHLAVSHAHHSITLHATRRIEPGDDVLVSYGHAFLHAIRTRHST